MNLTMKLKTVFIALITLLLSAPLYAAESTDKSAENSSMKGTENSVEIGWEDLEAKGVDFEDPFEALTEGQMQKLILVAEYREVEAKISDEDRASKAFQNIIKDYDEAVKFLEKEGVDIDGLLALREEITEKRRIRAQTPNEEINGKKVRIPGYLLPLEFTEKEVTEFLLVPWVGACIHTPPPPPIQIVHVKVDEGFKMAGAMYTPVWVEGEIAIESSNPELDFVDGKQNVEVGYRIESGKVEEYE